MPIDPRIALGVQPVQMPNFLEMAGQFANVRQSQAAEQNNLALLAQRQREERDIEAVRNYMSSPGFNAQNPNLIGELGRLAPTQGPALAKGIFDVQAAKQAATKAALETSSATNAKSLQTIASFDNPLQAWANIAMEERKGLDPQKAAAVRQSLKQAMAAGPTGFRDWQVSTLRKLLPVEDQLKQQFTNVGTGQEELIVAAPAVPGSGQAPKVIFRTPKEMTDAEKTRAALDRQAEARQQNQVNFEQQKVTPLPTKPGYGTTPRGTVVPLIYQGNENLPETVTRNPETGDYVYTDRDLTGQEFNVADPAKKARKVLIDVLGYGSQDFSDFISVLKAAPSGLLDSTIKRAESAANISRSERQALAKLEVLASAVLLTQMDFQLGYQISNDDRKEFSRLSGDMANPEKTVGERLAAGEQFINLMTRLGQMPDDGYKPFEDKGLPGQRTGGAPRTLSGTNLTVPTPPGQGTVTRAPPAALNYTPEEAAAALKLYGVVQ
jgi:hypothetical protein